MKVIALTGRAGSGKDTAALMLQLLTGSKSPHPYAQPGYTLDMQTIVKWWEENQFPFDCLNSQIGFEVHKFAWPVYQIAAILIDRNPYDMMNAKFKTEKNVWQKLNGRELLQKVGTECFRNVLGEDTWIHMMDNKLRRAKGRTNGVVISDLRFLNEDAFSRGAKAIIIKLIDRDSSVPTTHQSESELDQIQPDYTIQNTGTYAELMQHLSGICKHHRIFNCKYSWK